MDGSGKEEEELFIRNDVTMTSLIFHFLAHPFLSILYILILTYFNRHTKYKHIVFNIRIEIE